jgi:cobalt-precorrin 5A hydrolase
MKIACLSFTDSGFVIGEKIALKLVENTYSNYIVKHFANKEVEGGIKAYLPKLVKEYDGLVFVSATGIAVRMMTPFIKDKKKDPAVVVVDDLGRYSISLLSGHIGGANVLAEDISLAIDAVAIITTSSDARGLEAIDYFSMAKGYHIESMEMAKTLTAMMVNNRNVGFYSEDLPVINYKNLTVYDHIPCNNDEVEGLIIVSSKKTIDTKMPYVLLRPKNINIGIGCRRGVEGKKIIEGIYDILNILNLSFHGIKAIGTIDIKKDEEGIKEAAEHFNCPIGIFTKEEINEVEDNLTRSEFVKEKVGVYSVSEPCAKLLGGKLLAAKKVYKGITISITKEETHG